MTRNELNQKLAAVITTLNGVEYAPESILYLGLGANLNDWEDIKFLLKSSNLITVQNYQVKITPAGRQLADRIDVAIRR